MIETLLFILCVGVMTFICCDVYLSRLDLIRREDVQKLSTYSKDITIQCLYEKRNELRKKYLYNRNLENEKEILNMIKEIDNTIEFLNSDGYVEDICLSRGMSLNEYIHDKIGYLLCKANNNIKANIVAAIYTKNVLLTELQLK